jgi:imidazolonepropionase-like amidohydrolase
VQFGDVDAENLQACPSAAVRAVLALAEIVPPAAAAGDDLSHLPSAFRTTSMEPGTFSVKLAEASRRMTVARPAGDAAQYGPPGGYRMKRRVLISLLAVAALAMQQAVPAAQQTSPQASPQSPDTGGDRTANPYASTYRPLPSPATVIRNATILTAAGPIIERGSILLENGRIAAVGESVTAPDGAVVIDASGKWITPGIIDTHSHLGVYPAPGIESTQNGNEATNPNTAEVWAEHSLWPHDPQFALALAGGVTAMQLLPGSANLFGGRGVTVKNVPSRTAAGMKFPDAPQGLKMACGENPKRVYGQRNTSPSTAMANMAGYRKAWIAASEYREKWKRWRDGGSDPEKRPERNLQMETLVGVLDGDILVHNHCYRGDEMAAMIELSKEFGYRISSFHHAVEAYKVRDLLAQNNVCASMWADWWGFKLEAYDGIKGNIALVNEANGCAIVHSDDPNGIQRLNQEAAKAMHAGRQAGMAIDRAVAVTWITLNPARALGIDKVTGSLEAGKHADVVIWSGDPFSVYAKAEQVFIDGVRLFDRADPSANPRSDFALRGPGPVPGPALKPAASATADKTASAVKKPNILGSATSPGGMGSGPVVAITRARLWPGSGPAIDAGTLVIQGGKIVAVGADVTVPAGATIIDGTSKVVTPGFIESSTNLGIVEISLSAEGTADQATTDQDLGAAFTVVDAFNPASTAIPVTRVEGVTRALVVPGGTRHLMQGQAALFDLTGDHVPASVTQAPAAMLAALGERGAGLAGGSRASAMLRLREVLQDARDFTRNRTAWNTRQRRDYARGRLDLEALRPVVAGDPPLAIQANRASDLLAAMRLGDEFKLTLILIEAAEGWMVADEIAQRKIPVVVKPLTNVPSFDALNASLENAARLQAAGVEVVLSAFDTHRAGTLRQEVGNAIAYGMDREAALRAVTITPARVWGVSATTGSLEAGKDADVVIWSGDPFELTTQAERVFIRGREMPKETRQTELLERYRTIAR